MKLFTKQEAEALAFDFDPKNNETDRKVMERMNTILQGLRIRGTLEGGEATDEWTWQHLNKVGEEVGRFAEALGLPPKTCENLRRAAPLHDAGKLAVPASLLNITRKPTDEEFARIKSHAKRGIKMLEAHKTDPFTSDHPMLALARDMAGGHHKHVSGGGYGHDASPSLASRITALCDVFEAMTGDRPYHQAGSDNPEMHRESFADPMDYWKAKLAWKQKFTVGQALEIMIEPYDPSRPQFDAGLLKAFVNMKTKEFKDDPDQMPAQTRRKLLDFANKIEESGMTRPAPGKAPNLKQ
ncbi:MAG: HD domain-containing protein [Pseudomonadota bacterium]|nr:HD domain-containing protein [Pseudomonadota bacterium]